MDVQPKEFAAGMPLLRVGEFSVDFGSDDPAEGIRGPGDTPYYAKLTIPKFLWEMMGEPDVIAVGISVRLDDGPLSLLVKHHLRTVFMEPVYEGKVDDNAA